MGVDILLVEDDANDEELAVHAFKSHVDRVHVVRDGIEALDYVFCVGDYRGRPSENPRLILLDLKLPKVNGFEVLRQIRADPRTCFIPVVVLTTSSEELDLGETYRLGVNSYIVKPVDFEGFKELAKSLAIYWLQVNQQPSFRIESLPV